MKVKAKKIHKCCICNGNIQKGEIHEHTKGRRARYDTHVHCEDREQIGIEYFEYRHHIRDCYPILTTVPNFKECIKKCNFGTHKFIEDSCDFFDVSIYCEWCGISIDQKPNKTK